MSSRKRKQGDYEDLPPAKTPKHGFGEQPNLNEAATEGPGGTDDAILRFQNHQLFIRLKTQRRRIRELERNEDRVVARKERLDTELSLLRRVWARVSVILMFLVGIGGPGGALCLRLAHTACLPLGIGWIHAWVEGER